jgi:hypothetical protein
MRGIVGSLGKSDSVDGTEVEQYFFDGKIKVADFYEAVRLEASCFASFKSFGCSASGANKRPHYERSAVLTFYPQPRRQ